MRNLPEIEGTEVLWPLVAESLGGKALSVVMPVYALQDRIGENLKTVAAVFREHNIKVELIPVEDGSPDGTALAMAQAIAAMPEDGLVSFKPVYLAVNSGKGSALKAGFAASTGEYVMLLDGDLDINPRQTPWFFKAMRERQADIVVGSKRHPLSLVNYPWHRRVFSWMYFTLVRGAMGLKLTDTQTGMKLFRREVLAAALDRMLVKTYAFDLELLAIARSRGAVIAEAPVVIDFRGGMGALSWRTIVTMAHDSLAVFYRLRILGYYDKAIVPKVPVVMPKYSVVIACPAESAMLAEALAALEKQTYRDFEVIVLPDGGVLREEGHVRYVPTGKVRPAEKRNLGIQLSRGEVVAFLDDDACPDARWLELAVKYFGEEGIGAVGGPGVTPIGERYLSRIGGRVYENWLVSGTYRYRYRPGGVCREVDDFPSCNLLVRKAVLAEIGGYRVDFWPGEDTLLCKDIVEKGFRIVYDPWVVVNHHRRALFAPHLRQLGRYAFHRGYFCKRFPANSLHLSYFIPTAFVLYVMALPLVVLLPSGWMRYVALAPLAVYGFLLALSAFALNPLTYALTFLGVILSHLTYGIRFVQGLCAKHAPCEFIGHDHPSG